MVPAMSSSESTETLIRNPKESAVIFGNVVVLAVVLEFLFSYFRNHRSSYVGGLFSQLSEETMIVGCISLLFVFIVQSFPNLPDSWVVIFRWAQGVIFFMIVFFVFGVAWTALVTRMLCVMIQKFEFRLLEALTRRQNTEICDMLRQQWQLPLDASEAEGDNHGSPTSSSNFLLLKGDNASEPQSVQEDLSRLLRRRVGDLGGLRKEFGATAEAPQISVGDKEQRKRAKQVEQFLGDAALRLQDFLLDGSQFTTGGLRDPEPESALQSTLLVLRRVFLHHIRSKKYLPPPLHSLIVATERLRLTSYILEMESERRDLMTQWKAKRMTSQSHATVSQQREEDVLTFEDLMSKRRRTANEIATQRGRSVSTFVGGDDEAEDASVSSRGVPPELEGLKEGALAFASSYVSQRAQSWVSDGCIDPAILCRYVPFSKYLYKRMRTTVVSFVDITWQCWMSLVIVSSINSARLYMLPGKLQSKPELDTADYRNEMFSFIFVIGYTPMIAFLVAFAMLIRNFRWYLRSVKELKLATFASMEDGGGSAGSAAERHVSIASRDTAAAGEEGTGPKKRIGASVWLPPEQLAGQLAGDLYEDPSRYLLRGNKSFTLHTLKIPALLTHFYFSMFVVKLWNTGGLGAELAGYVLLGVVPVFIVFGLLPIALFAFTSLMSLGLRVDDQLVYFTAARQCRRVGGKRTGGGRSGGDARSESNSDHDEEVAALVAPLASIRRNSVGGASDTESVADLELAAKNLARRILGFVPTEMQHSSGGDSVSSAPVDSQSKIEAKSRNGLDASTIVGCADDSTDITASTIRAGIQDRSFASSSTRVLEQKIAHLMLQKEALEGLLRSSTGMLLESTAGTPQKHPGTTSRAEEPVAVQGSDVGGASATREILEYYKGLLLEQGALVQSLKEKVRSLEQTHRGGVLHPDFHAMHPKHNLSEQLYQDASSSQAKGPSSTPPPPPLPSLPEAVVAARTMHGGVITQYNAPPRRTQSMRRALEPVQKALDRATL